MGLLILPIAIIILEMLIILIGTDIYDKYLEKEKENDNI
jgi:hypothetical protein